MGKQEDKGGLGGMATMDYGGVRKEAERLQKVGGLVSEHTRKVSAWHPDEEGFDAPAQALVAGTVQRMVNAPQWKEHGLTAQEKGRGVTKVDIDLGGSQMPLQKGQVRRWAGPHINGPPLIDGSRIWMRPGSVRRPTWQR